MVLYFVNRFDEWREIARPLDERGAHLRIQAFLAAHNFKSYYIREWDENGDRWIDVGSHSEFFVLRKEEKNAE